MRKAVLVLSLIVMISACNTEKPSPIESVRANYAAMENEDVEAYLETVTGPRAAVAGTLLVALFDEFDVSYSIDSIELIGEMNDVAQVRTVVSAKDRSGSGKYKNNRMIAIHKLRWERGKWRIFFSEVEDIVVEEPNVAEAVSPRN